MFIIFTLLMLTTQNYIQSADPQDLKRKQEVDENHWIFNDMVADDKSHRRFEFEIGYEGKKYTPSIEIKLGKDLLDISVSKKEEVLVVNKTNITYLKYEMVPQVKCMSFKNTVYVFALLERLVANHRYNNGELTFCDSILCLPAHNNFTQFTIECVYDDEDFGDKIARILHGDLKGKACIIKACKAPEYYHQIDDIVKKLSTLNQ